MAGYRGGFGGGFGGFGGGNQMQNLMKQAQKMQKAQAELEETEIEGVASAGLVKVVMNGKKEVLSISISPDAVDVDDMTMLEDLIIVAINDAQAKADKLYQEKMGAYAKLGF